MEDVAVGLVTVGHVIVGTVVSPTKTDVDFVAQFAPSTTVTVY